MWARVSDVGAKCWRSIKQIRKTSWIRELCIYSCFHHSHIHKNTHIYWKENEEEEEVGGEGKRLKRRQILCFNNWCYFAFTSSYNHQIPLNLPKKQSQTQTLAQNDGEKGERTFSSYYFIFGKREKNCNCWMEFMK